MHLNRELGKGVVVLEETTLEHALVLKGQGTRMVNNERQIAIHPKP